MDFQAAIKRINRDFSNLFLAKYLKSKWGITAGFRTVPEPIAIMRKQIADWQLSNDCANALCAESRLAPVEVISYGTKTAAGQCELNPPLAPTRFPNYHRGHLNVNEILISSFTR